MTAAHVEVTRPRVGLVGLGLMGSSIGLDLRADGWRVVGYDADAATAARALARGAVDALVESVAAMGSSAIDLVIVCVPPAVTAGTVDAVLAAGATAVTDIASVKSSVVGAVGGHAGYVGGHPMAGREKGGADAAQPGLFAGARWVLTPRPETAPDVVDLVTSAVRAVGAEPVHLDPNTHDRCVAAVSHLPHLVASGLALVVAHDRGAAQMAGLAASGWRDTTRVASGPPSLWADIMVSNSVALVEAIDAFVGAILDLRHRVAAGDIEGLRHRLACAATLRDGIIAANGADDLTDRRDARRSAGARYVPSCTCDVPDAG